MFMMSKTIPRLLGVAMVVLTSVAPGTAGVPPAFGSQTPDPSPPTSPESPGVAAPTVASQSSANTEDLTPEQRLALVKRIFVESFGDDPISKQAQSMVIDALMKTKRFVVTENRDRADAILKGTAVEKTSQELHAISESGNVATASSYGHAEQSGSVNGDLHGSSVNGVGTVNGSLHGSSSGSATHVGHAQSVGIDDSQATTETIDDARISVRLVAPDGDVLWTTTQESTGAKYKGATADAADKVAKVLMREVGRLESPSHYPHENNSRIKRVLSALTPLRT